jgi:hypothetical protein
MEQKQLIKDRVERLKKIRKAPSDSTQKPEASPKS